MQYIKHIWIWIRECVKITVSYIESIIFVRKTKSLYKECSESEMQEYVKIFYLYITLQGYRLNFLYFSKQLKVLKEFSLTINFFSPLIQIIHFIQLGLNWYRSFEHFFTPSHMRIVFNIHSLYAWSLSPPLVFRVLTVLHLNIIDSFQTAVSSLGKNHSFIIQCVF